MEIQSNGQTYKVSIYNADARCGTSSVLISNVNQPELIVAQAEVDPNVEQIFCLIDNEEHDPDYFEFADNLKELAYWMCGIL